LSAKIKQLVPALLKWFAVNARDLPWRHTSDPYAIHVSEIMLQQTQVKTVIPFWERWMRELPTIQAAAQAHPDKLHKLWEGLGYYTRVRNLQRAAQMIVERHGGKFPEQFDEVLALPGVGRYTAGAICSIAFNQPAPILDGNVMRVLTRIFGIAENPREQPANEKLWALAAELVRHAQSSPALSVNLKMVMKKARPHPGPLPRGEGEVVPASERSESCLAHGINKQMVRGNPAPGRCSALNQSLMELGALICTPRNPQCAVCPARKLCVARAQDRVGELPNLGQRGPATARRFVAFVCERGGKFLVRQRPAGVVNAHLWEFPNVELDAAQKVSARDIAEAARMVLGFAPDSLAPLITIKHSITRYRITLEAFVVGTAGESADLKSLNRGSRRQETLTFSGAARLSLLTSAATKIREKGGVWRTPAQLHRLAFTAAHKRIVAAAA
jgi:A/G-specific adenine glycosylase